MATATAGLLLLLLLLGPTVQVGSMWLPAVGNRRAHLSAFDWGCCCAMHTSVPTQSHPLPPLLPTHAVQEKPQGAVPEAWLAALGASGLATADVAGDLGQLLSPKDEEEAKNVKKAAYLVANALVKFAVPQLEGAPGCGWQYGWAGAAGWSSSACSSRSAAAVLLGPICWPTAPAAAAPHAIPPHPSKPPSTRHH